MLWLLMPLEAVSSHRRQRNVNRMLRQRQPPPPLLLLLLLALRLHRDHLAASEPTTPHHIRGKPRSSINPSQAAATTITITRKMPLVLLFGPGRSGATDSLRGAMLAGQALRSDNVAHQQAADQYVRSFNRPNRSLAHRWCKYATPDIHASVMRIYPSIRFPVELDAPEEGGGGRGRVARGRGSGRYSKRGSARVSRASVRGSKLSPANGSPTAGGITAISGSGSASGSTDSWENGGAPVLQKQITYRFGFGDNSYLHDCDGYFSAAAIAERRQMRELCYTSKDADAVPSARANMRGDRVTLTSKLQLSERETHFDIKNPLLDSLGLLRRRTFSDGDDDSDEG